jgi:5-methylcytosine-specific restriction endonuclease McrA
MAEAFYLSSRWKKKREKIMRRDAYTCQYFKRYGKARQANTVHHIFPREMFPEYEWEDWNLIALSSEAHNMMHDRDTHELTQIGKELMQRTGRKFGIIHTPPPG